ncbi:hypothetical protein DV704_10185 [Meiothermus sp. QL-1]|uniref:SHOCT-like domain-containing protein n=1 Tax=Meiothermus sp. QL-1 TaxID=2058095 RepID=UPI000E0AC4EB|nr:hypothetical protein [Meiothermus sp. QL-1]RDI94830.1 hypothetical protein DV704_10185 [Meiothermus sp. QL-1]
MEHKERVMQMFKEGRISVQEALRLLEAMGPEPAPPASKSPARMIRIAVEGRANVKVNLPLGLARFALRFIPPDVQQSLLQQGLDLPGLLESLRDDIPEGRLVDVQIDELPEGPIRVVVEVV